MQWVKKFSPFFLFFLLCCFIHAQPAPPLPPMLGQTQASSQSSAQSSNSSSGTSQTWNELFGEGQSILQKQKEDLGALKTELQALKDGSKELMNLCSKLSKNNDALALYNSQIGQRMQERDEDLAKAYNDLHSLEKGKLRLIIVVCVLGGIVAVGAALRIGKLFW